MTRHGGTSPAAIALSCFAPSHLGRLGHSASIASLIRSQPSSANSSRKLLLRGVADEGSVNDSMLLTTAYDSKCGSLWC
jgi:hypothetical protein